MDDPPHDTNRLRTLLTACLVLLLVAAGAIAVIADEEVVYEEDWETGPSALDGYDQIKSQGTVEVVSDETFEGFYAMHQHISHDQGGSFGGNRILSNETHFVDMNGSIDITYWAKLQQSGEAATSRSGWILLQDSAGETLSVWYETDGTPDESGAGWGIRGSTVNNNAQDDSPTVVNIDWTKVRLVSEEDNDTIELHINDSLEVTTTITGNFQNPNEVQIGYALEYQNAVGDTRDHWIDNTTVIVGDPPPESSVELQGIEEYMPHDSTQDYEVIFNNTTTLTDVSDDSNTTVTSNNTSIITVQEVPNTITSTPSENVSGTVTITANYTDSDGITHTDTQEVVVAQSTMKNFKILPSAWRINALFSFDMGSGDAEQDTLPLIILISLFAGGITARVVSSFAGIGAMLLVIIVGWFGGWVGTGVVLSALFVGLFIGFNLAANIDYAVRR